MYVVVTLVTFSNIFLGSLLNIMRQVQYMRWMTKVFGHFMCSVLYRIF